MSQLSTNTLLVKLDWTKSCAVWLPWHLELEVHTTQCSRHLAQPDSPHRVGRFAASESPARRRPNPHRQLARKAPPQLGSRQPSPRRRLPHRHAPVDRKVSNSCQTSPRILHAERLTSDVPTTVPRLSRSSDVLESPSSSDLTLSRISNRLHDRVNLSATQSDYQGSTC